MRDSVYIPYVLSSRPDPLNILYSGDWVATNHLWSGLFDYRLDGSLEAVLAESWSKSLDGKTWTIKLKNNLKWSDGTLMTASQIVKSLLVSKKGTSHTDLSNIIEDISKIDDNTIVFKLNRSLPQFLESLTYSDWSIMHPDSIEENDGHYSIKEFKIFSGPYTISSPELENKVVKELKLNLNQHYSNSKNIRVKNGKIYSFEHCEELLKNIEHIASFRLYKDDYTPECEKILKEKKFVIYTPQPSWIIKADFTKAALTRIKKEDRLNILLSLQHKLKNEFKKIGTLRATGLRASNLYGSLPEKEFEQTLQALEKHKSKSPQKLKLKIISLDIWTKWKSYGWLISSLKELGYDVAEYKFNMSDFFKEFGSGRINENYDLIFFPLGVGDVDPDGSWRIASRFLYPETIDKIELHKAYLELDTVKRDVYYKNFAIKLLQEARYIPLVMNSDLVGVHESIKIKEGVAIRNGTALFDIE